MLYLIIFLLTAVIALLKMNDKNAKMANYWLSKYEGKCKELEIVEMTDKSYIKSLEQIVSDCHNSIQRRGENDTRK